MSVRYALFDLGRVVLDWEPSRLNSKIFDTEQERDWFLANVCTMEWHTLHDAGASFADNAVPLIETYPEHAANIRLWGERWMEMFNGYIEGTPEIIERLTEKGVPLYALTNMPSETKPLMDEHFPLLTIFQDIIVSGDEKLVKPDPAIFHLTLDRMGNPDPEEVIFIDDSAKNIDAATALGFETHHFRGAKGLEAKLNALGLL